MKAYTLDLRERVVKFVAGGGTRAQAARVFQLGERTVYRYLAAAKKNTLAPKTSWGHWRKLDPAQLQAHVRHQPDATLQELQKVFGVSHNAVWVRLRQLGFTLKKLIKYRERNEVQRWLFRRELEKLAPPACITSTSAAWTTGCIGNTDAPPEANGFMKRWPAGAGNGRASLRPAKTASGSPR